jgi:CDP-diacylglycerol pyrophosphatase
MVSRYIKFGTILAGVLLFLTILLFVFAAKKQSSRTNALWEIVHDHCLADIQAHHNPAPCTEVDLTAGEVNGFATLKDSQGKAQYLLIPTAKITGIESLALLAPDATNYFAGAWTTTSLVDEQTHSALQRTDFALAINSVSGRTQNQLHIHIDCIRPEVRSAIDQAGSQVGMVWQKFPVKLMGHQYRAIWLPGATLDKRNPFVLLAGSLSNPALEMGSHTLVLAGAERNGKAGFILLDGKAPSLAVAVAAWVKLGFGSGEELEDHTCRVATGT